MNSWFGSCPSDSTVTTPAWNDLSFPCTRQRVLVLIPASLAFVFGLFQILHYILTRRVLVEHTPKFIRTSVKNVKTPFKRFISLRDAEIYSASGADTVVELEKYGEEAQKKVIKEDDTWWNRRRSSYTPKTLALLVVAVLELSTRLSFAIYLYVKLTHAEDLLSSSYLPTWQVLTISAIPYFYIVFTLLFVPPMGGTPPYTALALMLLQIPIACIMLFGPWYDEYVSGIEMSEMTIFVFNALDLGAVITMFGILMSMPIGIPGKDVDASKIGTRISPEDYCALWRWITFRWVYPIVKHGTNHKLEEDDVWELSPTMQCRAVFLRFTQLQRSTLIRTIWASNSFDLLLNVILTLISIFFTYAGPFFLNRILSALDATSTATQEDRSIIPNAYLFATLTLLAAVCKTQSDLHHLWISRRCSIRVRSELTAAIYDKALKRKDFSGVVDKEQGNEKEKEKGAKGKKKEKGKGKKGKDDKDDPGKMTAGADIGKIVQMFQQDTIRISTLISGLYRFIGSPVEIILAMTFLYNLLGISAFTGLIVLVIALPLNVLLAKRTRRIQKSLLAARDRRTTVINEIVMSIKFIKFFAWENKWMDRAMEKRNEEIRWMLKARLNWLLTSAVWGVVPVMVSVVAFGSFVLMGNELTVAIAFTSIALFSMLRGPLNFIPGSIMNVIQAGVSVQRIETFLHEPEVDDEVSALKKAVLFPSSLQELEELAPIGIENASFIWNAIEEKKTSEIVDANEDGGDRRRFELRDVNVVFPEGKLTLVTGPTASGKSALLMALLGEMTMTEESSGRLLLHKEPLKTDAYGHRQYISYGAQTPWLQHQTIRENILFGLPMDEKRYDEVVECCALKPDLKIFEDGDQTEIGIRGVSLSGGQKARVALARAVYAPTKYVLLDDPLSAVDSHTARFLFEKLFRGPLLANRTVILVTHHIELILPAAHYIVSMLDGRIDEQGTIDDLKTSGKLSYIAHNTSLQSREKEEAAQEERAVAPEDDKKASQTPRKLVKAEERQEGRVKWKVYRTYLEASSYWTWIILLAFVGVNQGLLVLEKIWLRVWGESYKNYEALMPEVLLVQNLVPYSGFSGLEHGSLVGRIFGANMLDSWQHPSPYDQPMFYVMVYSAIGLGAVAISLCSSAVQITGGLRASRFLYKELLRVVMRTTFRFHDTTPAGRILNRFSRDMNVIDSQLALTLQQINQTISTFVASLLVVSVIRPLFLIPAAIIGYLYVSLAIRYLNSGRDLRRMESNARSPIVTGFSEMLDGLVTVRAFSAERRFLTGLFDKMDLTTRMWYTYWMTNRWLLLNYDLLGATSIYITMLIALTGRMPAGLAGLMITSAMSFTTSIYWTCRHWTTLEVEVNAMERVVEYLELPQEPAPVIESNRPPAYWPSSSSSNPMLEIKDLVVRYAPDLPAVLHGVSFKLSSRERVGLIGRTGSGKSTLAMSLLRFNEPSDGSIMIDGIDITAIGVYDLRSRLTFIPQDATLFSGTIRDNLDPFNEYTDAELLDVLQRVHLLAPPTKTASGSVSGESSETEVAPSSLSGSSTVKSVVQSDVAQSDKQTLTLDSKVSTGGTNFSQGQRQLIALGRALLRQSSIIIMDEATSSIDFETDAKLQAAIREEFKNSLLLTIAHRLKTIIDYDRLIVLDHGQVAEMGTPQELIQKEDGVFRNMCLNSGIFNELEEAAKRKAPLISQLS